MSDEPEYVFIKGQGWVASVTPSVTFKARSGLIVTIIDRTPEPGEMGNFATEDGTYCKDGKLILESLRDYWGYHTIQKHTLGYVSADHSGYMGVKLIGPGGVKTQDIWGSHWFTVQISES